MFGVQDQVVPNANLFVNEVRSLDNRLLRRGYLKLRFAVDSISRQENKWPTILKAYWIIGVYEREIHKRSFQVV